MIQPKNPNCRFYYTDDHIVVSHPTDEHYKKYWLKKLKILHDYPREFKDRTREQNKEIAKRVLDLILYDPDFKEYMLVSGAMDNRIQFDYQQHEMDMYERGEGKFRTRGQNERE